VDVPAGTAGGKFSAGVAVGGRRLREKCRVRHYHKATEPHHAALHSMDSTSTAAATVSAVLPRRATPRPTKPTENAPALAAPLLPPVLRRDREPVRVGLLVHLDVLDERLQLLRGRAGCWVLRGERVGSDREEGEAGRAAGGGWCEVVGPHNSICSGLAGHPSCHWSLAYQWVLGSKPPPLGFVVRRGSTAAARLHQCSKLQRQRGACASPASRSRALARWPADLRIL
jgi:hypothetical protein